MVNELTSVIGYCQTHAMIIVFFWPMITGVISLFYNWLDRYPRCHAVLAILVKAGFDLPSMLDAFKRLLTGQSVRSQKLENISKGTS